jgi:Uncharacterised protein family (UPF0180).
MKDKIAIEPAISNVKNYLAEKGYTVESMSEQSPKDLHGYDAVVVSGMNTNLLGMQDTQTKAVVINADGLSPEQVAERLNDIRQ